MRRTSTSDAPVPPGAAADRGSAPRWFEDVAPGDPLPTFDVELSLTRLVMYAGATWDFHRYHYDPAHARSRGMPAPVVDGQMLGALIGRQLAQWGGPDAFVCRLAYRLRGPVFAGERVRLSGSVVATRVEAAGALALCESDVLKADGTPVIRRAGAAIRLPRRGPP